MIPPEHWGIGSRIDAALTGLDETPSPGARAKGLANSLRQYVRRDGVLLLAGASVLALDRNAALKLAEAVEAEHLTGLGEIIEFRRRACLARWEASRAVE